MVDEYEDTTVAQRAILSRLSADNPNHLYAEDASSAGGVGEGGSRTVFDPPADPPHPRQDPQPSVLILEQGVP